MAEASLLETWGSQPREAEGGTKVCPPDGRFSNLIRLNKTRERGRVCAGRGIPRESFTAGPRGSTLERRSTVNTCPAAPLACAAMLGLLAPTGARAGDDIDGVTAVASKASKDYVRAKLPDGSFQPEYYAFGEGGKWGGEISDATIDRLHFTGVARVVAEPLASQGYLPARDPAKTRLLIMVYWGTTAVPGPTSDSVAYNGYGSAQADLARAMSRFNPEPFWIQEAAISEMTGATVLLNMENHQHDATDFKNAAMLGYDAAGVIGTDYGLELRRTPQRVRRDELISEIEENRYFVVLMAYDFQLMWKHKKHKLLWETRFSISERRNQFDKALPVMAQYASRYFGQDSRGLMRTRVPEGRVEIGEVRSLGDVPARPGSDSGQPAARP